MPLTQLMFVQGGSLPDMQDHLCTYNLPHQPSSGQMAWSRHWNCLLSGGAEKANVSLSSRLHALASGIQSSSNHLLISHARCNDALRSLASCCAETSTLQMLMRKLSLVSLWRIGVFSLALLSTKRKG